jgi:hypothetical protein
MPTHDGTVGTKWRPNIRTVGTLEKYLKKDYVL